ncbi:hypothetical protein DFQ28_009780 [Apophysomyces sp. BC1034]|nr:hypothetical protein DFQ30_001727 [Apophysomyces sp. BC1015]KAG0181416.1 hypothetical protein DFQ29_008383 [Apophysomyces sp. BC1021]KAG0194572.1 hypothetical protein DFQ28_009780 [Apophysomyces sp. BC1034]
MLTTLVVWSYAISVGVVGLPTACSFTKQVIPALKKYKLLHVPLVLLGLACSFVAEVPLHILLLKVVLIKLTNLLGGFDYYLPWIMYVFDLATMGGLVLLFVQAENTRLVAEEAIKKLGGKPIESIVSLPHLKQLINPFHKLPVTIYPNITYATNEESIEAIGKTNDYNQPRYMTLDVYTRSNRRSDSLRPVLVHIHGGAWQMGSKEPLHPYEALLVAENDWVVVNVNYRLAPANAYPTHLLDVKRALRWVKQSIESFGGDPNFVVIEGDSGGGQLAAVAAFTANEAEFQPGFEQVDTSVRGVITMSGCLDIQNPKETKEFFVNRAVMNPNVEQSFLDKHSPMTALPEAGRQGKLVPFLTIVGQSDSLSDCSSTKQFKRIYDQAIEGNHGKAGCTYLALAVSSGKIDGYLSNS